MLLRLISQYFINKGKTLMSQKYQNKGEVLQLLATKSKITMEDNPRWGNHPVIGTGSSF